MIHEAGPSRPPWRVPHSNRGGPLMAPEAVPSRSPVSPLAILMVPRQGSPQDAKAKAGMQKGDGKAKE